MVSQTPQTVSVPIDSKKPITTSCTMDGRAPARVRTDWRPWPEMRPRNGYAMAITPLVALGFAIAGTFDRYPSRIELTLPPIADAAGNPLPDTRIRAGVPEAIPR